MCRPVVLQDGLPVSFPAPTSLGPNVFVCAKHVLLVLMAILCWVEGYVYIYNLLIYIYI